jgi:ubiquinone/menaquinone biosynthesis C-methylase UbiE
MPLPDQVFDVALCSLGLEFMADKVAVLREMRRVLAPGGRLALNAVGPTPDAFNILAEALGRHTKPEAAGFVRQVFSLHDVAEIQNLIDGAGFRDVSVLPKTKELRLPSPSEFLWQILQSTPLAQAIAGLNDDGMGAVERDVVAGWQRFVADGVLVIEVRSIIATGRRGEGVSPRK